MTNTKLQTVTAAALAELKVSREKSYATASDVIRLCRAFETGEWGNVKTSRLYQFHGGEYCELQAILHSSVK